MLMVSCHSIIILLLLLTMSIQSANKPLGSVLVVGGCGFVGFHIVRHLLEDQSCTSVAVLSRNPSRNRLAGVSYYAGDITSLDNIRSLLAEIQPTVIIHSASPIAFGNDADEAQFHRTNVKGTQNLLECAAAAPSVTALVYTSSATVMAGTSFISLKETAPIHSATSRANSYSKSKAIADASVLAANNPPHLRTSCLRLGAVYGERDNQVIPGGLAVLRQGRQRFQIGDNSNLTDWVSADNVATAHLLAAKALLAESERRNGPKVGGEAFFITDGTPLPFWDFQRKVWAAAGDRTTAAEVTVVPPWFMLALASTVEWMYWIFTLGQRRPKTFTRHLIEYTCLPRTYSIEKARERLGYVPANDMDETIQEGVDWALEEVKLAERRNAEISESSRKSL